MTQRLHKIPRYAIEHNAPNLTVTNNEVIYYIPAQEVLYDFKTMAGVGNTIPNMYVDIYRLILSLAWEPCYHQDFVRVCKTFYKIIYAEAFLRTVIFSRTLSICNPNDQSMYIPCLALLIAGLKVSNLDMKSAATFFFHYDERVEVLRAKFRNGGILITDEPPSRLLIMFLLFSLKYDAFIRPLSIQLILFTNIISLENYQEISNATDLPWRLYSKGIGLGFLHHIRTNKPPPPYLYERLAEMATTRWLRTVDNTLDLKLLWPVKALRRKLTNLLREKEVKQKV